MIASVGFAVETSPTRCSAVLTTSCYLLFSGCTIQEFQSLDPDRFLPRAREEAALERKPV
jgi:hypothetical protein